MSQAKRAESSFNAALWYVFFYTWGALRCLSPKCNRKHLHTARRNSSQMHQVFERDGHGWMLHAGSSVRDVTAELNLFFCFFFRLFASFGDGGDVSAAGAALCKMSLTERIYNVALALCMRRWISSSFFSLFFTYIGAAVWLLMIFSSGPEMWSFGL